ncbi:MAG: hypothetical protein QOD08_917 [Gaiellaceae bacterium]|nr:hypothetical protein [Gaiellaceae bacterium]
MPLFLKPSYEEGLAKCEVRLRLRKARHACVGIQTHK